MAEWDDMVGTDFLGRSPVQRSSAASPFVQTRTKGMRFVRRAMG